MFIKLTTEKLHLAAQLALTYTAAAGPCKPFCKEQGFGHQHAGLRVLNFCTPLSRSDACR